MAMATRQEVISATWIIRLKGNDNVPIAGQTDHVTPKWVPKCEV